MKLARPFNKSLMSTFKMDYIEEAISGFFLDDARSKILSSKPAFALINLMK